MIEIVMRLGQSMKLPYGVKVTVDKIKGNSRVRLAFEAPPHIDIVREETLERENDGQDNRSGT